MYVQGTCPIINIVALFLTLSNYNIRSFANQQHANQVVKNFDFIRHVVTLFIDF